MIYCGGGKGLLTWPGGELTLLPCTAVLLASHTEYTYRTAPDVEEWHQECMTFLPRPHWYNWLRWPAITPGIMTMDVRSDADRRRIREAIQHTCSTAEMPRLLWVDFTMAAMEKVLLLLHELQLAAQEQEKTSSPPKQSIDPHVQTAVEFIEKKQARSITLDEIADVCGISGRYLRTLFRKHLQTTPQEYMDNFRINKAQHLLTETNKPISEIGRMVGYDRSAHFCYRFRKITGQTPSEHRKALK